MAMSTLSTSVSSPLAGVFLLQYQQQLTRVAEIVYPATPFFLYANPEMLKWTLESLYQYQEGGLYPNGYSMHDLGSSFPNATGHVEGNDEYMPVEESGNMILMSYGEYCPLIISIWVGRSF